MACEPRNYPKALRNRLIVHGEATLCAPLIALWGPDSKRTLPGFPVLLRQKFETIPKDRVYADMRGKNFSLIEIKEQS